MLPAVCGRDQLLQSPQCKDRDVTTMCGGIISLHYAPAPGVQGTVAAPPSLPWFLRAQCWAVPRYPTPTTMMVIPTGSSPILLLALLLCWVVPSGQERVQVQLRLAGPRGPAGEGRLEVLYQGRWGTVCDDGFDFHAATVACRQLGYTAAITWTHSATYGQGEGRGAGAEWGGERGRRCWRGRCV